MRSNVFLTALLSCSDYELSLRFSNSVSKETSSCDRTRESSGDRVEHRSRLVESVRVNAVERGEWIDACITGGGGGGGDGGMEKMGCGEVGEVEVGIVELEFMHWSRWMWRS